MILVLVHDLQPFIRPKLQHTLVRNRGGVNHQPRPRAFETDSDSIAVSSRHPKLVPRGSVSSGGVDISLTHQLHEPVCQRLVIRAKCKRNMIASSEPIASAIKIKESILPRLESPESGRHRDLVSHYISLNNREYEIIEIRSGRLPKFRLETINDTGIFPLLSPVQRKTVFKNTAEKNLSTLFIHNVSLKGEVLPL